MKNNAWFEIIFSNKKIAIKRRKTKPEGGREIEGLLGLSKGQNTEILKGCCEFPRGNTQLR